MRDRLGVKPLYYGNAGGAFVFASELKALRQYPGSAPSIDRNSVAQLMRYGYIPSPRSIYNNIRKLPPGCILRVRSAQPEIEATPRAYWTLHGAVAHALEVGFGGSEEDAVSELDSLLKRAVVQRMVSDVPLGVFLSGGSNHPLSPL